jgi:serine/threonine protein kinase
MSTDPIDPDRTTDAPVTPSPASLDERPGATIGNYRLAERLGEGGFGTVFLAEQLHPVRRQVALKVIKLGMDTAQVVARFAAERQALAIMDHPNIAKVFDAGATDRGRPYFVMELVRGEPITQYCDARKLTVPRRLELFAQVCAAVQHAHSKGVIHRDLKPGNVLVTDVDGRPTPRVIDFGIAKATDARDAERVAFTEHRQMIGTPQYMSPEQADAGVDVDTRSDVFSLGVMLYELLVGTTPFDARELRSKAYAEIQRIIREVEPPRPSTRLSTMGGADTVAAARRTEPARLNRTLRGELDWVVMRAMEKDRDRRYETADALGADVRRYLAGEPVLAAPPSRAYRLRKFVRRNRGAVAAAALVFAALLLGVVGTSIGLVRADKARRGEIARAEGERVARKQAELRLTQVKRANDVLGQIFNDLNPLLPGPSSGQTLLELLRDRLRRASAQIDGDQIGDPLTVADLQGTLGAAQVGLGDATPAIALLTNARDTFAKLRGADDPATLMATGNLAQAYLAENQFDRALPLIEATANRMRATLGPTDPRTLTSEANLAMLLRRLGKTDRAIPLLEQSLRTTTARFGPDHVDTIAAQNNLAFAYRAAG